MDNIIKYNAVFAEVFNVETSVLNDSFTNESVNEWDSVHQLNIIMLLEDSFDIMFDPEDIVELTSYAKGIELLKKYNIEI